ncbi:MAG: S-layer homology domain-containing protein [Candidatus Peregrinibacteria bacterium]|nr:S-layer homology domain-containing protein [Candidatus Peregrinibacteria bacterium]
MKNFKKFLNIFLLTVLVCTSLGSVQAKTTSDTITTNNAFNNLMFSDVYETNENFDAIYFLYNTNVINGYEDKETKIKEYKPEKEINRAEFLKLIMEGAGKATHKNYESCFPDIISDEWYETYVCQAKKEGFINGYPDGTFKPEETINEAEALKMIGEVMDWPIQKTTTEDWYKPYLNFAEDKKIITDDEISQLMNRGEIAEMIFRNKTIEALNLSAYDNKKISKLFDKYNIPFDGPLGPDGIFGHGGPFGNEGAFSNNKAFKKNGVFEYRTDTYFDNHYCYYSDSGEFQDDVEEILKDYTDKTLSETFIKNADLNGFGKVLCYSEQIETDLEELTTELRKEFEVTCWNNPAKKTSKDFDSLLCYVEPPKQTQSTEGDDSSDDDSDNDTTISNFADINISLNKTSILANGSSTLEITAKVFDEKGKALSDRIFSANIGGGIDYHEELEMMETSTGVYTATFNTKLAQDYTVHVEDDKGNSSYTEYFTATPGSLDHVEILEILQPYQNQNHNKAFIKVASKDKYENTLPYSSVNNVLDAITTFGTLSVTHDDKGIFTVELTASDWGIAEVSIKDKKSAAILKTVPTGIYFLPLEINMQKGINKIKEDVVEAPMYMYFPSKYGSLGSYNFTVYYDATKLSLSKVEDIDTADGFAPPIYEVDRVNGIIYFSQTNADTNKDIAQDIGIGKIFFDVIGTGEGTIRVDDIVLKNTEGEEQSYYAKFAGLIGQSVETAESAINAAKDLAVETGTAIIDTTTSTIDSALDGIAKWWYNIKSTKEICVDVFTFPNSNTTAQQINQDISWTNLIFSKIAASCNCSFYINVTLNSTTNLTAANWNTIDTNHDNNLDEGELPAISNNHPATGQTASGNKCAALYYVPAIDGGDYGWSWKGGVNGTAVDQSSDPDNRTVAHELAHQFSKNEIKDPNHPPASATQGADTAGNLMNYNNTGDTLTKEQCSLLEKYIK